MKSDFIANSIAVHLLDPMVKDSAFMLAISPTKADSKNLLCDVMNFIGKTPECAVVNDDYILYGEKVVRFISANSNLMKGFCPDYVFLLESSKFTQEQMERIYPMRFNAIVIESHGTIFDIET